MHFSHKSSDLATTSRATGVEKRMEKRKVVPSNMLSKRERQSYPKFNNMTVLEKSLFFSIMLSSIFKLLLTIEVSPFGMYQECDKLICYAAKLGGFTPTSPAGGCKEEGHLFLQAYIASMVFRGLLPSGCFFSNICRTLSATSARKRQ